MVLKRGDRDAGPLRAVSHGRLDEQRRFANSYVAAWQVWTTRFNRFLHLWWKPALACGLVGALWLYIRHTMYFRRFDGREILLDVLALWIVLFIWSAMRIVQKEELEEINGDGEKPAVQAKSGTSGADTSTERPHSRRRAFLGRLKELAAGALLSGLPLYVATLLAYLIIYIPFHLNAPTWVGWIGVVLAFVVLIPAAGTVQSYMEVERRPLASSMLKGLRLNTHYWGGMAVMWVISLCLLTIAGGIMLIGEVIVGFATRDMFEASLMGEAMSVPAYIIVLKYVVMFLVVGVMTLVQGLWSLPQQIHIRSVILKDRARQARRKQKLEDKEKSTHKSNIL